MPQAFTNCAPNPNLFFSRLRNYFVADHIDEKSIVVQFFLNFMRSFKVPKIRAISVHCRVFRRLGRVWSVTSTGEAISLRETLSEQQRLRRGNFVSTMPDT